MNNSSISRQYPMNTTRIASKNAMKTPKNNNHSKDDLILMKVLETISRYQPIKRSALITKLWPSGIISYDIDRVLDRYCTLTVYSGQTIGSRIYSLSEDGEVFVHNGFTVTNPISETETEDQSVDKLLAMLNFDLAPSASSEEDDNDKRKDR
jgi:hypothetical protein